MKISRKVWILYSLISLLAAFIWFKFAYHQLAFVDLSINKKDAFKKANEYLLSKGVDVKKYSTAMVIEDNYWVDRYLQKTIGFNEEEKFIKKYNFDLFYWSVRFFVENQKEEYIVKISSKSGQIISFIHYIEDTERRDTLDKEFARQKAKDFLVETFKLDFSGYELHEEQLKKFENRIDYVFLWEKKEVSISWKDRKDGGEAKLLTGATVSGNEIRNFYKNELDIPEKFQRYIQREITFGDLIGKLELIFLFIWIVWSVVNIIKRKDDVLIKRPWRLFLVIGICLFILQIIYSLNDFNRILFQYPTSSSLVSFLVNIFVLIIINSVLLNFLIVLLGTSSESLHYEIYPNNKASSFIYYLNSTIFCRTVAKFILFGYLLFIIFLGLQSILFYFGQKLLGVWVDKIRLTNLSSSYLPFLAVFIIGFQASFREEIVYRMFGINWLKKYIGSGFWAIIISALIWGFAHTTYPVFPIWFRGLEVGILGIFYGFIFLRFGIIPLITAHYLFDVFWESSAFIFGHSNTYLLVGSLIMLLFPFLFAAIAFIKNKPDKERQIDSVLDIHQRYNLDILLSFLSKKKMEGIPIENLKKELVIHGWDPIIVDLVLKSLEK